MKITFFMNFSNISTLSERSTHTRIRAHFWCTPMNFLDKIDEF
eukprot:UN08684